MKQFSFLLAFLLTLGGSYTADAQLMEEKTTFTKADTLRGTLSPVRDWFDVHYYDLEVKIMPSTKTIKGSNTIYYKVLGKQKTMQIDLFSNLDIDRITYNGKELDFSREFNAVFIDMKEEAAVGSLQKIMIEYGGKPQIAENAPWDGGLVWSKDDEDKDWIGVACQGLGASVWWPNKDHQSEEPDSMLITISAPNELTAVANGNLRQKMPDGDDFTKHQWFVSYPINNYNVTFNIADYAYFSEEFKGMDGRILNLEYYVLAYNLEKAKEHFKQVPPMMKCFEEKLGPYPFWEDGFALVETPYLGMEHQSAIAYGNRYLTGYAGMDYSRIGLDFDYIIIHEAGHEWWGNSITSYDIADMWIHEGFCTYSEALYVECMHGYEKAMDYVNAKKRTIRNDQPIIGPYGVNKEGSGDMYNKGMLFLNTVRHIIDDDVVWDDIIKGMLRDFEMSIINTDTVIQYMNRKSGKDLANVFDQYLNYTQIPTLLYKVDKKGKKLSYKWSADVKDFNMPIKYFDKKGQEQWLYPTTEWQTAKLKKQKNVKFAERQFYIKTREDS